MITTQHLKKELKKMANPQKAELLQRYFKTGKGEYGEGDVFLGITVPVSRKIAIKFKNLSFSEIAKLLQSKFHEERLIALLILVQKYNKADEATQKEVYEFYLKNTKGINNWDLVDLSSHEIVGKYLLRQDLSRSAEVAHENSLARSSQVNILKELKMRAGENFVVSPRSILVKLAKSKNIWERRIAVVSTFEFIRSNKLDESLELAGILLQDTHDLMHKAVGWMLREVGKRDLQAEIKFLNKYYKKMPRIMLQYAIEKFPEKLRLAYLKKEN